MKALLADCGRVPQSPRWVRRRRRRTCRPRRWTSASARNVPLGERPCGESRTVIKDLASWVDTSRPFHFNGNPPRQGVHGLPGKESSGERLSVVGRPRVGVVCSSLAAWAVLRVPACQFPSCTGSRGPGSISPSPSSNMPTSKRLSVWPPFLKLSTITAFRRRHSRTGASSPARAFWAGNHRWTHRAIEEGARHLAALDSASIAARDLRDRQSGTGHSRPELRRRRRTQGGGGNHVDGGDSAGRPIATRPVGRADRLRA